MFEREFQFFIENQEKLVSQHFGKILAIKGDEVVGVYDNTHDAYVKSQEKYPLGEVMLQPCIPGEQAYTSTISTVSLA